MTYNRMTTGEVRIPVVQQDDEVKTYNRETRKQYSHTVADSCEFSAAEGDNGGGRRAQGCGERSAPWAESCKVRLGQFRPKQTVTRLLARKRA